MQKVTLNKRKVGVLLVGMIFVLGYRGMYAHAADSSVLPTHCVQSKKTMKTKIKNLLMQELPAALKIEALAVGCAVAGDLAIGLVLKTCATKYYSFFQAKGETYQRLLWEGTYAWWVGAIIGLILVYAARFGAWPQLEWVDFLRPLMYVGTLSGIYLLVHWGVSYMNGLHDPCMERFRHDGILSDAAAYCATGNTHLKALKRVITVEVLVLVAWALYERYTRRNSA